MAAVESPVVIAPDPGDIPEEEGAHCEEATADQQNGGSTTEKHDVDFVAFAEAAENVKLLPEQGPEVAAAVAAIAETTPSSMVVLTETSSPEKQRYVTPKDFELLKVIGMGAFGKVLQVRHKHTEQILAMKVISKRLLRKKEGQYIDNINAERDILTKIRHPFIVTMHCSFQTKEKLFIIMDFLSGGELFLRLGREGIFLEKTAAFYLAEIILALDHLHQHGVLHRDLKPENILLGGDGHVCVTDFGLARDLSGEAGFGGFSTDDDESRARTVCGTQEYMSPEMLSRQGYGRASDYWSLGCIAYEMLSGRPPFESKKGAKDLFSKIMTERVKMPPGSTAAACKLLKGLLNRDVSQRLGTARSTMFEVGGVSGLKAAQFFAHLDWEKLEQKLVEPPTTLASKNAEDELQHFYDEFKQMPLPRSVTEMTLPNVTARRVASVTFRGFSFCADDFLVPDRRLSEIRNYYENVDEDGESASDAASSKLGDQRAIAVEEEAQKKKRPARKRKKKNKNGESNETTTAPSLALSETEEIDKAGEDAENPKEPEAESIAVQVAVEEVEKEPVQKPLILPESPAETTVAVVETIPIRQEIQVWEEVKSSSKKKPQAKMTPQHQQQQSRAPQRTSQTAAKSQAAAPRIQASAPEPYKPVPDTWAAVAHHKKQPTASEQQKQQQHLPQNSRWAASQDQPRLCATANEWTPAVAKQPAPSGDWRSHSLVRNTPVMSQQREVPEPPQMWPGLDSSNFPAAGNPSKQQHAPRGAWAARTNKT